MKRRILGCVIPGNTAGITIYCKNYYINYSDRTLPIDGLSFMQDLYIDKKDKGGD